MIQRLQIRMRLVLVYLPFEKNVILLCGGKDKHISFDDLKQYDSVVKKCISFGQTKDKFKDIFSSQISVETMKDALKRRFYWQNLVILCYYVQHVLVLISLKIMKLGVKFLNKWFMTMQ